MTRILIRVGDEKIAIATNPEGNPIPIEAIEVEVAKAVIRQNAKPAAEMGHDQAFERIVFELSSTGKITAKHAAHLLHARYKMPCICRKLGWLDHEGGPYEKHEAAP